MRDKSGRFPKLDPLFVRDYFAEQGCELFDDYKNARADMKYRCVCGNISYICWDSFRGGSRCKGCGLRKIIEANAPRNKRDKISIDDLVVFKKEGHTHTEAAEKFGINKSLISIILNSHGITNYEIKHGDKPKELTDFQKQVVVGTLLGDAGIAKGHYDFKQKGKNKEYVDFVANSLKPFSGEVKETYSKCNGKLFQQYYFQTPKLDLFVELGKIWYKDNIKILPPDLELTPQIIALWFCDDGTNGQKSKCVRFSTEAFRVDEVSRLIEMLGKFDIESYIKKTVSGPIINVRGGSYMDFINLVKPYISYDCMKYKSDTSKMRRRVYKVTDDIIDDIRALYATGCYSMREIQAIFNLSRDTISRIISGKHFTALSCHEPYKA